MNRWMRKVFGCANPNTGIGEYYNSNAKHWTDAELHEGGQDLIDYIVQNNPKGIYSVVARKDQFEASGHCDLLRDDATCLRNCYFKQAHYFKWLDIWKLQ